MTQYDPVAKALRDVNRELERLRCFEVPLRAPRYVPLSAPLTSTSWDGDGYSTTAKTLIDLSVVFGAPAGIVAIDARVAVKDSGSAAAAVNTNYFVLAPTNAAGVGKVWRTEGLANDFWDDKSQIVPCDANGDIYYQVAATGAGTMDVVIQILGYWTYGFTAGNLSYKSSFKITNVNAIYTVADADEVIRCNGTFTVTLPAATGSGRAIIIKNSGVGNITIDAAGAETIDGAANDVLASMESDTLLDGSAGNWDII